MEIATAMLTDLFIMFLMAKVAGEIFERLHQPAVIGELLIGIAIGPYALGWVGVPSMSMVNTFHGEAGEALESIYMVIAELGVVVLLFHGGPGDSTFRHPPRWSACRESLLYSA